MSPHPDPLAEKPYHCRRCHARRTGVGGPPMNWMSIRVHKTPRPPENKNFSLYALLCSRSCAKGFVADLVGVRQHSVAGDLEGLVQAEVVPDINHPDTLAHSAKR